MNDLLNMDNPASAKRGANRDSLLLKAVLRFANVSEDREVRGLMAEAPMRVARGEPVEIHLRSIGWISGHVAWVTEGRIGIAFDHPINPKDARKPVGQAELDMPNYLKKLNEPNAPNKYRRL
jgi:hypothetical protein